MMLSRTWQRKQGDSSAEEPPLTLLFTPTLSGSNRPWHLHVITLNSSASSTSWRSEGRAGSGSNETSPRGPRSTGCRSTTGRTLTCLHLDPCPSSCGCRARFPYLAKNGREVVDTNLRGFSCFRAGLAAYLEWCCPGRSRRNPRWTCG